MAIRTLRSCLLLCALLCFAAKAQNFHRNYGSNYIPDSAKLCSVVHGGAMYLCYNEDSVPGSATKALALLKIGAGGSVQWKRHYFTGGGTAAPVKLLADSARIFIGGNHQQSAFIAKIDTGSGAVLYFRTYKNTSFVNSSSRIFDMCYAWPGEIMAVGRQSNPNNSTLIYMLRLRASDGNPFSNAHSQTLNDIWAHSVAYLNGKVYLAGEYQQSPMLARLALSGGSLVPAGASYYNQGLTVPSAFTKIEQANGRMVCAGKVNGSAVTNYVFDVDTAIIGVPGTVNGTLFGNSTALHDLVIAGTNVHASGIFNGKPGVISFTSNLNISSPVTYSHIALGTVIEHWNNRVFLASFRDGSSSSIVVVKGDMAGSTECSLPDSAPGSQLSGSGPALSMSVISQGQVLSLAPVSYTVAVLEADLCPLTALFQPGGSKKPMLEKWGHQYLITAEENIRFFSLHDMSGRSLSGKEVFSDRLRIDLEDQAPGIYLLKLEMGLRCVYLKLFR